MTTMIGRAAHEDVVDVVVIGAGQSGLAMSHYLAARSIDHVIIERGEVANSWRKERWDSLRLLTPNWLSRLPGHAYGGDDPDGYMGMREVIDFISTYARASRAPVLTGTTVTRVEPNDDGYRIVTDRGVWQCRAVVIASGAFNKASVPGIAAAIPDKVVQVTAFGYKNPGQLDDGGVLIVGASATGLQLADEIHASGRPVTISVGEHVRMPRTYRGRDIQWWMLAAGLLDQHIDEVDDVVRARHVPSPQLVGKPDHSTLDLNALSANGVRIAGRLAGVRDGKAQFSGSLRNVCALADLKMQRLLKAIDEWAQDNGLSQEVGPVPPFAPTMFGEAPLGIDLNSGEIRTIIWATGYRPDYSWLEVPVLDRKGRVRHDAGVADAPGMYLMGLPFLRRRKSSFIHGADDDARELCAHLAAYLDADASRRIRRIAV
jgi:putative flavoprotein involved in K+ transport